MSEPCLADELRTLFLFEQLSDAQLDTLCAEGRIEYFPFGPICVEGEPATCFYVLIDGELVMSKRSGGVDIETNRTSQRGVYCGAWSAYIPDEEQNYQASVRATRPSKFFVLDAESFAAFMRSEFPMAVHLLEGHMVGGRRQSQIIGQRQKLLALGTITAGLTHQLNNPAAATARAVADLREGVGKMRHKLAMLADGKFTPEALRMLVSIQDEVAEQVAKSKAQELSALETSDREDQVGDWLEDHGIVGAWDYAPTFVEAGLDVDWLRARRGLRRRGRLLGDAAERHRMAEVHHRHRAADERDRRRQRAHLGVCWPGPRSTPRWTGPNTRSPTSTSCCTARSRPSSATRSAPTSPSSWSSSGTRRSPRSLATQAI